MAVGHSRKAIPPDPNNATGKHRLAALAPCSFTAGMALGKVGLETPSRLF